MQPQLALFGVVLWSCCYFAITQAATQHASTTSRGGEGTINVPQLPTTPPNGNPITINHTNFFVPPKIYDLASDNASRNSVPSNLIYKAYSAVGYDIANTIWLVTSRGIVVIDTLGAAQPVGNVTVLMRQILNIPQGQRLPLAAIIYTHNHLDHTGGVQGYLNEASLPPCPSEQTPTGQDGVYVAQEGCVEVIGQVQIVNAVINTGTRVGTIINPRSLYMYGAGLPLGPINNGIGPFIAGGDSSFYIPSRTFTNQLRFSAAGLWMQIVYVPSETNDEAAIFVPDALNVLRPVKTSLPSSSSSSAPNYATMNESDWQGPGLLMSAEVIQGPAYPNLYSLRGTSFRSPQTWYESVDVLRSLDSWCMVPSHGVPLCGQQYIQLLLVNFRDAIQFTHDQTLRFTNKGYTPDETTSYLNQIPAYLVEDLQGLQPALPSPNMDPLHYLLPLYGTVQQSVRETYTGYLGWFTADPVNLQPIPPKQQARRYIQAMGGRNAVLVNGMAAIDEGDRTNNKTEYQWAAELAALLVRADNSDRDARRLKAIAYLKLEQPLPDGSSADWHNWDVRSIDPNWSNWFRTAILELGLPNQEHFPGLTGTALTSPGIISNLPPSAWVHSWSLRLNAEVTTNFTAPFSMGFLFPPNRYILEIRRAVAQFITVAPVETASPAAMATWVKWRNANATINMTLDILNQLLVVEKDGLHAKYRELLGSIPTPIPLEDIPFGSYTPQQLANPLLEALIADILIGKIGLLTGTVEIVRQFFGYFDDPLVGLPYLTIR